MPARSPVQQISWLTTEVQYLKARLNRISSRGKVRTEPDTFLGVLADHALGHSQAGPAANRIGEVSVQIKGGWGITGTGAYSGYEFVITNKGILYCNGIDGAIIPQTGAGAPVHASPEGTIYWDTTNNVAYFNNNGTTGWTALAAGAGAPTGAQYVVLALDGTLTAERRLVLGSGLQATDGGANGDYTMSLGPLSGTWAPGSPTIGAYDFTIKALTAYIGDAKFQLLQSGGNPFIYLNGSTYYISLDTSPNDLSIVLNSVEVFRLLKLGQLSLPKRGTSGGLLLGGDALLYSPSADLLQVASGDTLALAGDANFKLYKLDANTPVLQFSATGYLAQDGPSGQFIISSNAEYLYFLTGQLQLPKTGLSGAGLLIGGDAGLGRSAANTLALFSGDSLDVPMPVVYSNVPDAAVNTTIVAGNAQGKYHHSGPKTETAFKLYVEAKTAPGASGLPCTWQYGDTDDLDTVASWTEIATATLSSEKTTSTTSMTNASIPANRIIRTNWGTIVGTPKDGQSDLHVYKPLKQAA